VFGIVSPNEHTAIGRGRAWRRGFGYASDNELEADFAELERAARAVEAELGRRAAEIDRRGSFRRDGYLSISSWLAHRFGMAFSAATQLVRVGRALEQMPDT
jgi:hypothetical protein